MRDKIFCTADEMILGDHSNNPDQLSQKRAKVCTIIDSGLKNVDLNRKGSDVTFDVLLSPVWAVMRFTWLFAFVVKGRKDRAFFLYFAVGSNKKIVQNQ